MRQRSLVIEYLDEDGNVEQRLRSPDVDLHAEHVNGRCKFLCPYCYAMGLKLMGPLPFWILLRERGLALSHSVARGSSSSSGTR